jgi:hypothetical protein
MDILSKRPNAFCYLSGGELQTIYQKVFGRAPTQSEVDQLTQNTAVDPYGKKLIDANAAEAENYFNNTPEMKTKTAFKTADQAQAGFVAAAQPAINTLNSTKTDLDSKYKDLLDSIGVSEGVASDKQTLATNNEMARRGISSNSGIAEQEAAHAQLPISAQFGQLKADTGVKREASLTSLAEMIANLQKGDYGASLGFANGQQSLEQQAQTIANNLQLGLKSQELARDQFNFDKTQADKVAQTNPYVTLGEGQSLFNTQTGQNVYTNPKTFKAVQGNLNGGF